MLLMFMCRYCPIFDCSNIDMLSYSNIFKAMRYFIHTNAKLRECRQRQTVGSQTELAGESNPSKSAFGHLVEIDICPALHNHFVSVPMRLHLPSDQHTVYSADCSKCANH